MKITNAGSFMIGKLQNTLLSENERAKLMAMASEETTDELFSLIEQAQQVADPVVLFSVCSVIDGTDENICINGIQINSKLVAQKLRNQEICFPFVATGGAALENWSLQYKDDFLTEFWADEIKKIYLQKITSAFFDYLTRQRQTTGHLTTLNPGSLEQWPISGQRELFDILGGSLFVQEQTGVRYTDSFLMLPVKSISGIGFESSVFYENCQYCGRLDCPNRRASWKAEGDALCIH